MNEFTSLLNFWWYLKINCLTLKCKADFLVNYFVIEWKVVLPAASSLHLLHCFSSYRFTLNILMPPIFYGNVCLIRKFEYKFKTCIIKLERKLKIVDVRLNFPTEMTVFAVYKIAPLFIDDNARARINYSSLYTQIYIRSIKILCPLFLSLALLCFPLFWIKIEKRNFIGYTELTLLNLWLDTYWIIEQVFCSCARQRPLKIFLQYLQKMKFLKI